MGVNVYVPFTWLSTVDGLHVPVIPSIDVAGKTGATDPIQTDWNVPNVNVGVMIGFTVTVYTYGTTQGVAEVNVYVPLACVFTTAGFHVPVIPLFDVAGNTGTVPPAQIVRLVPKLNTGVSVGLIVTVNVVVVAH